MPKPTLPTTRIDCTVLAPSSDAKKSMVSSPSPVSLLAFGSLRREAEAERRMLRRLRQHPDLGADDQIVDVVGAVAGDGDEARQRRRMPLGNRQMVVEVRRRSAIPRSS